MKKLFRILSIILILFFCGFLFGCDITFVFNNSNNQTDVNEDPKEEDKIKIELDYIDLDIINYTFNPDRVIEVNELSEMQMQYDAAIINRASEIKYKLNFDFAIQDVASYLSDHASISDNYSTNFTSYGDSLTIKFTFTSNPLNKASEENLYIQYNSANVKFIEPTRDENFDDFKINESKISYDVRTSNQLFYVLERATKPNVISGSEAEIVYNEAKDVLRQIINDDMNDLEKLKAIHDYLIMNVTYDAALADLLGKVSDTSSYRGFYLEGVFLDKRAVCEGISKAVVVLCNMEGIPCVQVSGHKTENPNSVGHAWNKVNLNGKWYIFDATSDGTVISNTHEIVSYEYFLISDEKMETIYTGEIFTNLKCEDNYKTYSSFYYDIENKKDFEINSYSEFVDIVRYFSSFSSMCTIQFDLKYSSNFNSEMNKVCRELHLSNNYTYLVSGTVYTLIDKN